MKINVWMLRLAQIKVKYEFIFPGNIKNTSNDINVKSFNSLRQFTDTRIISI